MKPDIYVYLLVMAATVYAIRVLPLTLLKKPIRSRFLRSFLYYMPYITLALMTFPAIVEATRVPAAGIAALLAGVVLAWAGLGLFPVAVSCCLVAFVMETLLL